MLVVVFGVSTSLSFGNAAVYTQNQPANSAGAAHVAVAPQAYLNATPEEWAAASGVEAMLLDTLVQEMRKSVPENDLMPASQGEKIFRQMLDNEYTKTMSNSGSLGIAQLVLEQMKGKR